MPLTKLNSFTKKVADLPDSPTLDAASLKAQFDAAPDQVRQSLNSVIDVLKQTTNDDSGADNIGATSISGVTGTTIQAILEGLKSYVDSTFLFSGASGLRIERLSGVFFTNGASNSATASVTFSEAFQSPPVILPGDMNQAQSYGDVILYPYIYNVTNTGFSVKINAADGHMLGTSGSPGNIFMHFVALGA